MKTQQENVAQGKVLKCEPAPPATTIVGLRDANAGHPRLATSHSKCDKEALAINHCKKKALARELLSVIHSGDYDQLQDLLRSKPDLNVMVNGQTALHYCLLLGMFARVAQPCAQLRPTVFGVCCAKSTFSHSHILTPPLFSFDAQPPTLTLIVVCLTVVKGRDVSWLKQLIANGANPNLSNRDGWHPIHLAAVNGHHEILTYLITCNSRAII